MNPENEATKAMGHNELFQYLWKTKYAPAIADDMIRRAERLTDAFTDATLTVCGEEIRMMTGRDLLILDGFENGFVTPRKNRTEDDRNQLLWNLSAENDGTRSLRNAWNFGRFNARMRTRDALFDMAADEGEIFDYLDRIFLDVGSTGNAGAEQPREQRPPPVHFLSDLLVAVARTIGATDPFSGRLLADVPIPRLLQYQRSATSATEEPVTEFDSQRSRCLEEVNAIILARRTPN